MLLKGWFWNGLLLAVPFFFSHFFSPSLGAFAKCRYVYYGKNSEGNRFIRNDQLWLRGPCPEHRRIHACWRQRFWRHVLTMKNYTLFLFNDFHQWLPCPCEGKGYGGFIWSIYISYHSYLSHEISPYEWPVIIDWSFISPKLCPTAQQSAWNATHAPHASMWRDSSTLTSLVVTGSPIKHMQTSGNTGKLISLECYSLRHWLRCHLSFILSYFPSLLSSIHPSLFHSICPTYIPFIHPTFCQIEAI